MIVGDLQGVGERPPHAGACRRRQSAGHHVSATVRAARRRRQCPKAPRNAGSKPLERARTSARRAESIDGAEHGGSIESVMAGRTRHRRVVAFPSGVASTPMPRHPAGDLGGECVSLDEARGPERRGRRRSAPHRGDVEHQGTHDSRNSRPLGGGVLRRPRSGVSRRPVLERTARPQWPFAKFLDLQNAFLARDLTKDAVGGGPPLPWSRTRARVDDVEGASRWCSELLDDVRIDHRRLDVRVPEVFLDLSDIHPVEE